MKYIKLKKKKRGDPRKAIRLMNRTTFTNILSN